MSGRLFRTVRQAEPFREMGKFLSMTVLAGGALYFVNEPVAAFFYTRQAAQAETRRQQQVAAESYRQELAHARSEHAKRVALAEEYLRQLEERVFVGAPSARTITNTSLIADDNSNSKTTNTTTTTTSTTSMSTPHTTSTTSSISLTGKISKSMEQNSICSIEPSSDSAFKSRMHVSSETPNALLSIAKNNSHARSSNEAQLQNHQILQPVSASSFSGPTNEDRAFTLDRKFEDRKEGEDEDCRENIDVRTKPHKMKNWKSASRRMIQERTWKF